MGKRSTFHVESMNGEAFLNFSTYLGPPRNVHFYQNQKTRSKSERKARRDNERAAMFQAKMNQAQDDVNQSLQSRISSSSTPKMKIPDNVSDTTDKNESDIDVQDDTTTFTSDTTSHHISADNISDSETIIPDEGDENELVVSTPSETLENDCESESDDQTNSTNDTTPSASRYPAGINIDYSQTTECWSPSFARMKYADAKKTGQPLPPHDIMGLGFL